MRPRSRTETWWDRRDQCHSQSRERDRRGFVQAAGRREVSRDGARKDRLQFFEGCHHAQLSGHMLTGQKPPIEVDSL